MTCQCRPAVLSTFRISDAAPVSAGCCRPAMVGGGIELTFRARVGAPALAVVNSQGGCDTVLFTLAGQQQPALAGSGSLIMKVLKTAGLHWHVIG